MSPSRRLNPTGHKIQHALQIALSHESCGNQLQSKVVWPAAATDGFCKTNPALCPGNIPYGALLALPPGVNIAAFGLSEAGTRLALALHNYGAYVVDATTCPIMPGDQYIDGGVRQSLINDMRKLYPQLRMVLNNSAGQTASGGGTPRAENCAFNSASR